MGGDETVSVDPLPRHAVAAGESANQPTPSRARKANEAS